MPRKTIIMLSAKRCGSTAIYKMFQKHPDIRICHVDPTLENWEPNFWNLGTEAIAGNPSALISRFEKSHPFLRFPDKFSQESIFRLWDNILEEMGPVVFDKSPQYLGNIAAMDLVQRYMQLGNDVRFFAFIRDPRDAITSQYELWRTNVKSESPKKRELAWLAKYHHLEDLQEKLYIPVFRYEDFFSSASLLCLQHVPAL